MPSTANLVCVAFRIFTKAFVTRLTRSSNEPAQPTQNKTSGASPFAASSAMVGVVITNFVSSKLTKVMIEMFVHANTPLVWSHFSEERMNRLFSNTLTSIRKFFYQREQAIFFSVEVSLIDHFNFFTCRTVVIKWFIINVFTSEHWPDQAANKNSLGVYGAHGHFQCVSAMSKHLCHIHFAPLPRRLRRNFFNAIDHRGRYI